MAALDWEQTRQDGVTLVELAVTAETAEAVRIESELRPVWPPRRQGVPAAGWDETGFCGRVTPDQPLVVGYASPATPAEPPARVQTPDEPRDGTDEDETARRIVQALGQNSPPRDAIPTPDGPERPPSGGKDRPTTDADRSAPRDRSREREPLGSTESKKEAVESWFGDIEARLDDAEQLAGISGADEARSAIDTVGGIDAVRALQAQLEQDSRELDSLGDRQRQLANRLAAVEIPLGTLERVT